jgi:formate hydrogenlyase transcriptional activator
MIPGDRPPREEANERRRFERLLVELSNGFINRPPDEVDRGIEDAQRRVCETLGLDMSSLWQWPASGDPPVLTHVYRPPGGPPLPEPMNADEHFPWIARQMRSGALLQASSLSEMPGEAARDREVSAALGIKSFLAFPLSAGGGAPFGAVTFNTLGAERQWPDQVVRELQLVAQIFANALARKRGDEALRLSQARLASAADLAALAFYEIDYSTGAAYFDDRFRDVCGLPPDHGPGFGTVSFWLEHLHPDDRPGVDEGRARLHDGRLDRFSQEYRYDHPSRGERWIHHLALVATRDAAGRAAKTIGVLRDITERRRSEESLRRSLAEIERLKDRLQAESDYLKAEIQVVNAQFEVTGKSAAIHDVLRRAEQVAPTDSTVLVSGETGTGKELLAQAIHRLSPRGSHVMVKVNCAALPSSLVESELFGREKGAFTGALSRQVGRFEIADGSTLFLDEVGELPPDVQVKLLRVLQAGEFERLGSPRTLKVNVRVIAATNRDLPDEVRKGRFREDLFYRLNVFPIRMPPLRERPEDIPVLVWAFLDEFSMRMGKRITQVPRATMEALQRQPWPGNVRELRNVIEHGAIITTGSSLRLPALEGAASKALSPKSLAEAEREHILRVLESTGWRIKGTSGAAEALAVNPSTLRSRMKKLGIAARRNAEDRPV